MNWILKAFGEAGGALTIDGMSYEVGAHESIAFSAPDSADMVIRCDRGKLGESDEDYLFVYPESDPTEGLPALSATFHVDGLPAPVGWQAGYGIYVLGNVEDEGGDNDLLNMTGVGRHRCRCFSRQQYGIRITENSDAGERIVDTSRVFQRDNTPEKIREGDTSYLKMDTTPEGFVMHFREECLRLEGNANVLTREPAALSIGFLVGAALTLSLSEIHYSTTEGSFIQTPVEALQNCIPPYPFAPEQILAYTPKQRKLPEVVYVSPDGREENDGSLERPLDLGTALYSATERTDIRLLNGVYLPENSIVIPERMDGNASCRAHVRAVNPRAAVIDGSRIRGQTPAVILKGDWWQVEGIVVCNSPSVGMLISGNCNLILNCETWGNADTGILICAYPGAGIEHYPSYNRVEYCDSHDNCDDAEDNADGFGAKLAIGAGNSFYQCAAYDNCDDGFDLYSKRHVGAVQNVELDRCAAWGNQNGFKLGGENVAVRHVVRNSLAFQNRKYGLTSNSNPEGLLENVVSLRNGENDKQKRNLYLYTRTVPGAWKRIHCRDKASAGDCPSAPIGRDAMHRLALEEALDGSPFSPDAAGKSLLLCAVGLSREEERCMALLANALSKQCRVLYYADSRNHDEDLIGETVIRLDGMVTGGVALLRYEGRRHLLAVDRLGEELGVDTVVCAQAMPTICRELGKQGSRIVMLGTSGTVGQRDAERLALADCIVLPQKNAVEALPEGLREKALSIPEPIVVTCSAARQRKKRIAGIAHGTSWENLTLMLNAFECFYKNHSGYELMFCGVGREKNRLTREIRRRKLSDQVFLLEETGDISGAEMAVICGTGAPARCAAMEIMMLGLCCVALDRDTVLERLVHEKDGLIAQNRSAGDLAEMMSRVADCPELRVALEYQARINTLRFQADLIARRWQAIL